MAQGTITGGILPAKTEARSIKDLITIMRPEIEKALPSVLTGERFARMATTALSQAPELAQCTPKSFLGALMQAAQLGLEPNTPLGQAYFIPYKNKGRLECQFQLGYRGMITLAYRSGITITAHEVHENDAFDYAYGLDETLTHRPAMSDRGAVVAYYATYHTKDGGRGFIVMSRDDVTAYMQKYSKAAGSSFSPWNTNFDSMAKKTCIKQLLKYAPLNTEFVRAASTDGTIKSTISPNMEDAADETAFTFVEGEAVDQEAAADGQKSEG